MKYRVKQGNDRSISYLVLLLLVLPGSHTEGEEGRERWMTSSKGV